MFKLAVTYEPSKTSNSEDNFYPFGNSIALEDGDIECRVFDNRSCKFDIKLLALGNNFIGATIQNMTIKDRNKDPDKNDGLYSAKVYIGDGYPNEYNAKADISLKFSLTKATNFCVDIILKHEDDANVKFLLVSTDNDDVISVLTFSLNCPCKSIDENENLIVSQKDVPVKYRNLGQCTISKDMKNQYFDDKDFLEKLMSKW